MSKLPAEFVKAPVKAAAKEASPTKQPRARRPRKAASLISPEPMRDPRELVLQLTEEEYQALEEARQKLHQAGAEVTLDQMIHRVFADWMMRVKMIVQPEPPPAPAAAEPAPAATAEQAATPGTTTTSSAAARDEHVIARLRGFLASPIRTWQELASQLWRRSHLARGLRRAMAR